MKLPKARKRGSSWFIEIMIAGEKLYCTRDTEKECTEWAAEKKLAYKATGKVETAKDRMLVRELFDLYHIKVGQYQKSSSINKGIIERIKRNFPHIANMQVNNATPVVWTKYRNERLEKVKNNTVRRELAVFSACFSYAVKELFIISENPFRSVAYPQPGASRHRRISEEEIAIILDVAGYETGTTPRTSYQYVAWSFLFCIETALRRGELLDIDMTDIYENHIFIKDPKAGPPRIIPTVNSFQKVADMLQLIDHDEDELVPYKRDAFDSAWGRIYEKSGIIDLQFRDTRHEAISRFVAEDRAKEDDRAGMVKLMKITGHTKPDTFFNVYYNPTVDDIVDSF